ncbi:phosphate-starvation-inducible PsiE family protein [Rhizorhabdus sp.]|uniref:phosphate-starvation-inducible protein PsiE n=1 Tax=Rhizorhabdus sp. TaxID=1968843 RepID=UPI00198C0F7E|nr:phosphate-starvation-inducible PsiE family protein [Rhizorhabdus sp.]MBD3762888.1 phosphate-starvation-inducible PsiE family protein [Rhizorhabdus sp.]
MTAPPNSDSRPEPAAAESPAGKLFKLIEQALLMLAAIMTLVAAGVEVWSVYQRGSIVLADILLMFLYTEVIAMIAVFYTGKGSSFVFPIFIAITAIARLIVLQGKDMQAENVVYEASAILLLAVAALVMGRVRSD